MLNNVNRAEIRIFIRIFARNNIFINMDEVTSLISNVGFPIAVCVALFYFMMKQEDKHREETDRLNATVEANTKVLTELCTLIKTLVK